MAQELSGNEEFQYLQLNIKKPREMSAESGYEPHFTPCRKNLANHVGKRGKLRALSFVDGELRIGKIGREGGAERGE